jgi:hypothetical protein
LKEVHIALGASQYGVGSYAIRDIPKGTLIGAHTYTHTHTHTHTHKHTHTHTHTHTHIHTLHT